jgi:hypothetical protein
MINDIICLCFYFFPQQVSFHNVKRPSLHSDRMDPIHRFAAMLDSDPLHPLSTTINHAATFTDAFSDWTPPAPFQIVPNTDGTISAELVHAVGTVTNTQRFQYAERLYDEFCIRGVEDGSVLTSFIKALSFRRCRSVATLVPLLTKIFQNPLVSAEDWEDLASIVCDLGSKSLVNQLTTHSMMATRQHRPCYYSHLMRFAAEQLEAPCFGLVMAVVDAINATGATWTEATMYHLLGAFCRIKDNMPYETILHLVAAWRDARLREDSGCVFPTLIMSRVLSLCERALGPDIVTARAIMDVMGNREEWNRCIAIFGTLHDYVPPPAGVKRTVFLIDPSTIDVSTLGDLPDADCYYAMSFSSLRVVCERAELLPDSHRLITSILTPIRHFFCRFTTHAVVTPPDVELAFRVGGFDELTKNVRCHFDHMCPKCVCLKVPLSSVYGKGFSIVKNVAAHECGLPSVLPSSNASVFSYLVKSGSTLHSELVKSVKVLTSNKAIINELQPLTDKYAPSWFKVCRTVDDLNLQAR